MKTIRTLLVAAALAASCEQPRCWEYEYVSTDETCAKACRMATYAAEYRWSAEQACLARECPTFTRCRQ